MNIPNTYSEWVDTLEYLKTAPRNDEFIIKLNNSQMQLEGDLKFRFINKLDDLIQTRINNMLDKFINKLGNVANDANTFSLELLEIKKEYKYLILISKMTILPQENSQNLIVNLKKQAVLINEKLKSETTRIDRTGMLTSILNNNNISNLEG